MKVDLYDTTLGDGSRREGLPLPIDVRLRIVEQLDRLGIHYIEGGSPGTSPRDAEFFSRARRELRLDNSVLVAHGHVRRRGVPVDKDLPLQALARAEVDVVCIEVEMPSPLDGGVDTRSGGDVTAAVRESVEFLKSRGKAVMVRIEHFFAGFADEADVALSIVHTASDAGARTVVLADSGGVALPHDVADVLGAVTGAAPDVEIGCCFNDDSGCAVADSLAAVRAGATHVQGSLNGLGERAGNTNLAVCLADLQLKMGVQSVAPRCLATLTPIANHVAELLNIALDPRAPYVGASAFAHESGLNTSSFAHRRIAHQHVDPAAVGNRSRFVPGELAARSSVLSKAVEFGIELDDVATGAVVDELEQLQRKGYHFEVADGSLELLFRRSSGRVGEYFDLESYRIISDSNGSTEATVRVLVDGERTIVTGEGNGPVNALDRALRKAIEPRFPALADVHLTDYRVRVLDTGDATGATTRVLIDTSNGDRTWTTIGVSDNIIDASWQALNDSLTIALLRS